MTKFHKTFRRRLIILSISALVGIIAMIHGAVYVATSRTIAEHLGQGAQGVAVAVALEIMENIEDYKLFLETRDVTSGYYQNQQDYLTKIKEGTHAKFVYTERRINENTIEFVLDAEPVGSQDYSAPGDTEENYPLKENVYSTAKPATFPALHFERWGGLLCAYAPIVDHDGTLLGLAGVDIDASLVNYHLNKLQVTLFIIYALIIGLVLIILTKFSNAALEPFFKDRLTGAYTKRYSHRLIHDEIVSAVKSRSDLALMVLDLDHFKNINDTYGHNFGDKVLTSVSETIRGVLRQQDYFIRYGGEEFITLFPKVSEERAMEIAERIRQAVEASFILKKKKKSKVGMTVSIGVTALDHAALSTKEMIDRADKALYAAKKSRNCISLYAATVESQEQAAT
jgi:diguanylate cyclase (GGDEF)-like protein